MAKTVLYIHGMGGGGDSRIPSILKEHTHGSGLEIVVRTYDFDPETAAAQIALWVEELHPAVIVGESLGALHATRIKGLPHIMVSPALNAPLYFGVIYPLAAIPGVTWLLDRIYRPREGDRQKLHFIPGILKKYPEHRRTALANSTTNGSTDFFFAFFGTRDHYRRSGIVNIRTWRRYFGDTCALYPGIHFMEEEFVLSLLLPKIIEITERLPEFTDE